MDVQLVKKRKTGKTKVLTTKMARSHLLIYFCGVFFGGGDFRFFPLGQLAYSGRIMVVKLQRDVSERKKNPCMKGTSNL